MNVKSESKIINKAKPQKRTAWLKLRVTPAEKEAIAAKASSQGQTITDFIRQRALDYRLRQTPLEKEHLRQLARIGVNLNQLARWANIHKSRAETVQVLVALLSLERTVRGKDTQGLDTVEGRDTPPPLESAGLPIFENSPCT